MRASLFSPSAQWLRLAWERVETYIDFNRVSRGIANDPEDTYVNPQQLREPPVALIKMVEYINTHHLAGHMMNEWVYGGYLIWAAPEHPVFVDGRGMSSHGPACSMTVESGRRSKAILASFLKNMELISALFLATHQWPEYYR